MNDIIDRLRRMHGDPGSELHRDAEIAIMRLRAERDALRAALVELIACADASVAQLCDTTPGYKWYDAWQAARAAIKESEVTRVQMPDTATAGVAKAPRLIGNERPSQVAAQESPALTSGQIESPPAAQAASPKEQHK